MQTLELAGGGRMPALGLGTWKSAPGEVGAAVREAVRIGYRHVDCAAIYGNEPEVGEAIHALLRSGIVERGDLWFTSKLWNDSHAPRDVRPALERTLRDLRLDELDLYLVHWPVALRHGVAAPNSADDLVSLEDCPLIDTWRAVLDLKEAGLCRHVGVSNFSAKKLGDLAAAGAPLPSVNQVELHPYLQQPGLAAYAREQGIVLTAYSPLGSPDRPEGLRSADDPRLLDEPVVGEIARRRGATPAQVLLAWGLACGHAVIPKSVNPARIAENLAATEVRLEPPDLEAIAELDRHRRYLDGSFWVQPGGPYDLANLWDEAPSG